MSQKLQELFTRQMLVESVYKNIIAINEHDLKFLKAVGIYCLENFRYDINDALKDAEYNSQLLQQLRKESKDYLKGNKSVYWNQKDYSAGSDPVGYHLVSIDRNTFNESKGNVLTKYIQEDYITVYLPLLEDWCRYYIRNGKESLGRKIILSSVMHSIEPHKMKKLCIYKGSKEELVDKLR